MIISVVAANTGNNLELGVGDSVIITFDQNTNKPPITASTINSVLTISGSHSFGKKLANSDIVWNAAGNILTITFSNITGTSFVVGDKITISKTANLKDALASTLESTAVSPTSTGSFTAGPVIASIVAKSGGPQMKIDVGDSVVITFNQKTNKPTIAAADLDKWFVLGNGHKFGSSNTISWNSDGTALTVLFKSVVTNHFEIGDRITLSTDSNVKDSKNTASASSVESIASTGSFSTAPAITSVIAYNSGQNIGLDYDDTLVITFDKATNSPVMNAENLRTWFAISNSHSFGTALGDSDAVWDSSGRILTITFSDPTGSTFAYGDTVRVTQAASIMDSTGEVKVNEALSPPSTGTFTFPPRIVGFHLDNPSEYNGIMGTGDTISIVFDQLTNKPAITASKLNELFLLKNSSNSSQRKFSVANISSIAWSSLDGQDTLTISLTGTITPSSTSIDINDTYIDLVLLAVPLIKDVTSSIAAAKRLTGDEPLIIDGSY